MKIQYSGLESKDQTGEAMYDTVNKFSSDLDKFTVEYNYEQTPLSKLPLKVFYDYVRNIPYRRDGKPVEVVARPKYILSQPSTGFDCKKKAILMASWLRQNNVPYRFMSMSRLPSGRVHHVFVQGWIRNRWRNIDATYKKYSLFEPQEGTRFELLR